MENETPGPLAAVLAEPKCDWSIKDALALANTLANHGLRDGNADAASSCIYSLCRTLLGNAAAIREALQELCDCTSCDWSCIGRTGFDPLNETCLSCTGRPERDGDCPWIRARAALAAPARNCDTVRDGREALGWCRESVAVERDAAYDRRMRDAIRWLLAPAKKGGEA